MVYWACLSLCDQSCKGVLGNNSRIIALCQMLQQCRQNIAFADPVSPGTINLDTPILPPEVAKEAVKDQLVTAARRAVVHSIRLVYQASSIVTGFATTRERPKALPCPDRATSPTMCVQLRLLDGQIITQMVVSFPCFPDCCSVARSTIRSIPGMAH